MTRWILFLALGFSACDGGFIPLEERCDNDLDDDGDGATDCDDSQCAADAACQDPVGDPEVCDNGTDDDGDGDVDCADSDCARTAACSSAEDCDNGTDDDGDGVADCADSDCASDPACASSGVENCTNGVDDDGDFAADCADSDCASHPSCQSSGSETCTNGVDDDADGQADCADPDCHSTSACTVTTTLEPCFAGYDSYDVAASGTVTLAVDTTSAATTFDPYLYEWDGDRDAYGGVLLGDDEITCTFPPPDPDFGCPSGTLDAGSWHVMVGGYDYEEACANDGIAGYRLTLRGPGHLTPHHDDLAFEAAYCDDGVDNDGDGLTDALDTAECEGSGGASTLSGTIVPCENADPANQFTYDTVVVTVSSGTSIVTVDVVSPTNTMDPFLAELNTLGNVADGMLYLADDELDCTVEPANGFGCPEVELDAGTYELAIGSFEDGCTTTTGAYVVTVTGDATVAAGAYSDASYFYDDVEY